MDHNPREVEFVYNDLSSQGNSAVDQIVAAVFSMGEDELLDQSKGFGIELDEGAEVEDLFCMMIELTVKGIDRVSQGKFSVFDLTSDDNSAVYLLNRYLRKIGFQLKVDREEEEPYKFIDRNDYYYRILPKPNNPDHYPEVYVENYILLENKNYDRRIIASNNLREMKAYFVSKEKVVYTVRFEHNRLIVK